MEHGTKAKQATPRTPKRASKKTVAPRTAKVAAPEATDVLEDDASESHLPPKRNSSELKKLWGADLIDAGWVAIPSTILEKQHALGMTPTEFNVFVQIARFWWTADNLPHPSKATIAKAMNMDPRTVQRVITALEKLKLVKRHERRTGPKGSMSTRYDFSGLIEKATPFAQEALAERERVKGEKLARLKRMRPRQTVKVGDDAATIKAALAKEK